MPGQVITLLTDFGLADPYVGVMKGVILGINSRANLVDLTHEVSPQDILQGSFLLSMAWRYFPNSTVHLAVVDPGVGTKRQPLLLEIQGHFFLTPDNGLVSFVLPCEETSLPPFELYQSPVPDGCRAYHLTNHRYWRHPVSATFNGRDVFAPVAAHLSLGLELRELGVPVNTLIRLAIPVPRWRDDTLLGHVLHVDRFGNVVTSVPEEAMADDRERAEVQLGGRKIQGLVPTYAVGQGLIALVGSHGYLEVALTNGNASQLLGVKAGDEVAIRRH